MELSYTGRILRIHQEIVDATSQCLETDVNANRNVRLVCNALKEGLHLCFDSHYTHQQNYSCSFVQEEDIQTPRVTHIVL